MSVETVSTIAGSIAAVIGGIRWLLKVYFKQQQEIEKLKKTQQERATDDLKETLRDFKIEVNEHRKRLLELESKIASVSVKFEENREATKRLIESIKEYVRKSEERIKKIETEIMSLGSDVKLIRTKKNG